MNLAPNRIATYLTAAAGAATAIAVPLAGMDTTSVVGVVTGIGAILIAFGVWMVGWQKHEARQAIAEATAPVDGVADLGDAGSSELPARDCARRLMARTLSLRNPPMRGADVAAVQKRLAAVAVDGEYGVKTGTAVYQWKWRVGFRAAEINTGLGARGQALLLGTTSLSPEMRTRARQRAGKTPPTPKIEVRPATVRERICDEMGWLLEHRGEFTYRQVRAYPASMRVPEARNRLDCSATVTLAYKAGGAPDPNGRGYDGFGWTGSLWPRGAPVAHPQSGDLAFYGHQSPGDIPSHVAVHDDDPSYVVSFGHTPPTRYPLHYRADYRGSRNYLA